MKLPFRVPKSITFLLGMTILTGVLYPAALTLAAQLIFPNKANGSLLVIKGAVRGSRLLAQKFESPRFFRARPSASDYTYVGAGASNLGPVSADLAKAVADRRDAWAKDFGTRTPEDMLYASASGLDPDIGLEAALAQADRVAGARSLSPAAKAALVDAIDKAAERSTTLIGPPRVNVVSLNALLETTLVFSGTRKGG
ncbi:MAG: potassium-transporting ATPase subunit C [Rectinemataceae bacterium]|jgi:K+-transporting ATPase ATPase C chain